MENKKKRIVIALGGNALGNTLPEQMIAVKITAKHSPLRLCGYEPGLHWL